MTTHLVTFSDESMSRAAELCVESAKRHGFDDADAYSRADIETSGWADGPQFEVLRLMDSNPRGAGGWWCWKPFIILEAMMMCGKNDVLAYSDAGVEFLNNVNYIIDRMDQDIWLFGNQYEHAHWCKRDIVEAIWPAPWEAFGKQAQASVIFFRVSDYSKAFVAEWLKWCLMEVESAMALPTPTEDDPTNRQWVDWKSVPARYLIDDSPSVFPNHPEFRENRHDQAILTTMAYRDGIKLHYWPAQYNEGAFVYERGDYPDEGYPILFHHHRRRNHEWESAA